MRAILGTRPSVAFVRLPQRRDSQICDEKRKFGDLGPHVTPEYEHLTSDIMRYDTIIRAEGIWRKPAETSERE